MWVLFTIAFCSINPSSDHQSDYQYNGSPPPYWAFMILSPASFNHSQGDTTLHQAETKGREGLELIDSLQPKATQAPQVQYSSFSHSRLTSQSLKLEVGLAGKISNILPLRQPIPKA
ncbi:uncharacterized protein BDR25DRAFT_363723 [Lindgomyces ingoldianus]|uniref:Uncharacterized protein n=1 Tax=Lindgomyces ingoldianus TaxID=673940 RepID=A0ACB6Q789_9PLEO|nr:uncharacterized protein BDR25DRAFT_363723 [Lindgomyces ingoldianus]KAF2462662.1 hypothetical protein BDR25DRAFT_363723 [Lindgomyces ingoldianus]